MNPFDTTLGTIRCETSHATINALLFGVGLRAQQTNDPHRFAIVNGGRGDSEPEVDHDLWELALVQLRRAERDGALPKFTARARRDN